jgi:uncharacterized integral membrane protein (TIGR00698 family)
MSGRPPLRRLAPGLAVLLVLGALARGVGRVVPALNALIVAIALGVVVQATTGLPEWAQPGANRHKLLLETGIVLLGAQLTLGELVSTGPLVVALAAGFVLFGVLYVETLSRLAFDLDRGMRALLAAGASICGVSAILAVAGTIDVDEADVTYAVATVLLFDAVTLVVFPILGTALGLSGKSFGIWAGVSLFSTGPTAAVGFAVSDTAGQWATVTKLVRNTFIGVLAMGYALQHTRAVAGDTSTRELWYRFPKFLVGFLVVVAVTNVGLLSPAARASIETTTDWLFTLAFVGLGFGIDVGEMRAAGARPIALVAVHLLTVSALALLAVTLLV